LPGHASALSHTPPEARHVTEVGWN